MYSFNNSILLILFNNSKCINIKDILLTIYGPHFKTIIFYADCSCTTDSDINYILNNNGCIAYSMFEHFYNTYSELLKESDGLFYTMYDNLINVNILNLYKNDKIIYYNLELNSVDDCSGLLCDNMQLCKAAIHKLLDDYEFKKYNINSFCKAFSNWFYLPRKYLTSELFDLLRLFSKYNVSLEIAIPSIINNIEKDKHQYQSFTDKMLYDERVHNTIDKLYLYTALLQENNLILYPINFKDHTESSHILYEILCKNKCVIITTINKPTETIIKHLQNPAYDVIIVGDIKTPDIYKSLRCIYLDVSAQKKLFPELSDLLPYNHYCRKNIGYLYAIKRGYSVIYETDDDNIPYDGFDNILNNTSSVMLSETSNKWINIFKYFTGGAHVWPRGYPLSLIKSNISYIVSDTDVKPSIINGLVENDPDVDAIFRLTCIHQDSIKWEKDKSVIVNNKNICVFNTQNTFWLNSSIFMSMLIPASVSFRYCDILRGVIANIILNKTGNYMSYSSPNVIQNRNEHNLISDFKSEYEMYIHNEHILKFIDGGIDDETDIKKVLTIIYENLLKNNVIKHSDIELLQLWMTYF